MMTKKLLLVVLMVFLSACSSSNAEINQAVEATIAARDSQGNDSVTVNPTLTPLTKPTEPSPVQPTLPPRSTNTPLPTVLPPTPPTGPSLKLIPYNYTLEDEGNGWTRGSVEIAIENDSSQPYFEQDSQKPNPQPKDDYFISLGEATLQTEEGQPYPIEINGSTTPPD